MESETYSVGIVEWQEDGYPLGIISLRAIEEPRLAFQNYEEGMDIRAKCHGFPGLHPAKILKLGSKFRTVSILSLTNFIYGKKKDYSKP